MHDEAPATAQTQNRPVDEHDLPPAPAFLKWLFGLWWVLLSAAVANGFARSGATADPNILNVPTDLNDPYYYTVLLLAGQVLTVIVILLCLFMFFYDHWEDFLATGKRFGIVRLLDYCIGAVFSFTIPLAPLNVFAFRSALFVLIALWTLRLGLTLLQTTGPDEEKVFKGLLNKYGYWFVILLFLVIGFLVLWILYLTGKVGTVIVDGVPRPGELPRWPSDILLLLFPLLLTLSGLWHLSWGKLEQLLYRRP